MLIMIMYKDVYIGYFIKYYDNLMRCILLFFVFDRCRDYIFERFKKYFQVIQ